MIEFTVEIAGYCVLIKANFESTKNYCSDFLSENKHDFIIEICEDDILKERQKAEEIRNCESQILKRKTDAFLETIAVQRKLADVLVRKDTLLMHGSAIALDGEGIIFTAKSGTGKSTHTRLWREVFGERAVMINDDKPFIRIGEKKSLIYGSPWNGKHRLGTNMSSQLKAICILERSEENKIERITKHDALPMLFSQTKRPENRVHIANYIDLIDRLINNTLIFKLQCNKEIEAAIVARDGMMEIEKGDRFDSTT